MSIENCYMLNYALLVFICLNPNPKVSNYVTIFGDKESKEVLVLSHMSEPSSNGPKQVHKKTERMMQREDLVMRERRVLSTKQIGRL
jgi:hypothetical protein